MTSSGLTCRKKDREGARDGYEDFRNLTRGTISLSSQYGMFSSKSSPCESLGKYRSVGPNIPHIAELTHVLAGGGGGGIVH